jgi:hypothetical protein
MPGMASAQLKPVPLTLGLWLIRGDTMENPTREPIIHRAYQLWEQAGKPDGRDQEFYHQAERELRQADQEPATLRTPDNL